MGFTSFLQVLEESKGNQRKTKELFAFGLEGQLEEEGRELFHHQQPQFQSECGPLCRRANACLIKGH